MTNPISGHGPSERLWLVDSLRLTTFPSPSTLFNAAGQWEQVVGHAPDSQTIQPARGNVEEIGKFEDGQLQLAAQPVRVDWNYLIGNFLDPESTPNKIEVPLANALQSFLRVAERSLTVGPGIRRVAFGAILIRPVQSKIDGYLEMAAYLKTYVKLDPEGSSDFLYQINRPRQLGGEPQVKINRLSKWSVGQVHFTQIAVNPGIRSYVTLGVPVLSMRLELDINTDADFQGDLPQTQLADLLHRLTGEATEIAVKGDVP